MENHTFVMKLHASGVITGPDHFVLGDGFGNPGSHASMFVVEERLEQNEEIKQILINRIWEQVSDISFDIVVCVNPQSYPIAQSLADLATKVRSKKVFACRCDSELPPGNPRRALVHDNIISKGLQVADLISMMEKHGIKPVALSSLFTRIEGPTLFSLPLYMAFERLLPTYDEADCPMCHSELKINNQYGKGGEYLRRVQNPYNHSPSTERPEKILIVDDEKGIRETFSVSLGKKGYETVTAKDYNDAITKLEECNFDFDVILTDQVMPGRSGLDLIKAVKERTNRIQLIMLTGEPTIDTAAESVRLGIFDYLEDNSKGIMVWGLEQKSGVSANDIDSISGIITSKVEEYSGRKIVSEADIKTVLRGEEARQQCGVEGSSTCMVEIGAALGVPEAVSGDLGYVGNIWVLNLRRVNLRTSGVIKRASRQVEGDLTSLVRIIPSAVGELFGKKIKIPLIAKPAKEKPSILAVSGYSLLGGGTAFLILGGIATWQMDEANQSDKSKFDTWKKVSIAGYVIGGAAVATGIGLLVSDIIRKKKAKKAKNDLSISLVPAPSGVSASIGWRW